MTRTRTGILFTLLVAFIVSTLMIPATAQDKRNKNDLARQAEPIIQLEPLEQIQQRIAARGYRWTPGRTSLSDYTAAEFNALLGAVVPPDVLARSRSLTANYQEQQLQLPTRFDWRDYGGVSSVKNQAGCGSCWDFAAVGALEAMIKIYGGIEYDLSEQQVLSCAAYGWGCGGGWMSTAWALFKEEGAALETCMPYQADDTVPCTQSSCQKYATTNGWEDIPNHVEAIKQKILEHGPVATTFTVYSDFYAYTDGCYEHPGDDPINHAVVIVGWEDTLCGGEGAWLIKNSWGEGWGMDGYFWIKYGSCNVGTATQAVYYYEGTDIVYTTHSVGDGGGDGDGRIDPGETVALTLNLRNDILAPSRTGISAGLSCSHPLVEVTSGTSAYPDMNAGDEGASATPYQISFDRLLAVGETVDFALDVTADGGYSNSVTVSIQIGDLPILLVDDDAGGTLESYFETALDNNGYLYDVWNEHVQGGVTAADLAKYYAVVWMTGISGRLNSDNQSALAAYMDAGGRVCFTGQDIGWYMIDWSGASTADSLFYANYLHALYNYDDSGFRSMTGIPGDPIGDGLSLGLGAGDGSRSQDYPSEITGLSGTFDVLQYAPSVIGAIRCESPHRMVYLAFGLEAVNTQANRDLLMYRILEYLAEGLWPDIDPPTVTLSAPDGGELWTIGAGANVQWTASDNSGACLIDILLSRNGGLSFDETLASGETNDGSYLWPVSGPPAINSKIMIMAVDTASNCAADTSAASFSILEPAAEVPALSSWGLIILALLSVAMGGYLIKRKRTN